MENKVNSTTRDRGLDSESKAQDYLEQLGFKLIEKNFLWRGGEIDLVMQDRLGSLVFIEVRSALKRSEQLKYSLTYPKLRRLHNTADLFCKKHKHFQKFPKRFDVVWIEAGVVEHWTNVEI